MKRLWHKLLCLLGKHETKTVVLNRPDGSSLLSGTFCVYCDFYKLNEVDDEQIIPAEETDPY